MTKTPNFREFYQSAPISIGENDRLAMRNTAAALESVDSFTHWLIALEGEEYNSNTIHWKVVIYPLRANGEFDYLLPYFVSSIFESIHEGIEFMKQLTNIAKQDQLAAIHT
ncbi:hypothetical protein [Bacillus sp. Marseille-P3661]|uniref:hypothetical protein n=1 Tax=Bacillus sp. Marseille-P3661 TaxID=1936234 RepID=UPI000C86124E|nr:hypothetical protein [Bacillus sp. Marseille-P3661]